VEHQPQAGASVPGTTVAEAERRLIMMTPRATRATTRPRAAEIPLGISLKTLHKQAQ